MIACLLLTFIIAVSAAILPAAETESPPVESLIESLQDNDFATRERALNELFTRREMTEKYAPALREQLHDTDAIKRQVAAMALAALGVAEKEVIDELMSGMGRRSFATYLSQPEKARSHMAALVKLGPSAVPALIKAIEDEHYAGRDLALEALGELGPTAKEALPAIERQLVTDDVPNFCRVVEAKWRIDGDAPFAIGQMVPLLDHDCGRECHTAVRTLVHMGGDAKDAMPALITALKRYKSHNVLWAISELAPHAHDVALPALREALTEPRLADQASIALHALGEPTDQLIPPQLGRLQACTPNDGSDPMQIVYTIVIHGPAAKPYVNDLIALLAHENPEVRSAAAWGIPRMFADDELVIPVLKKTLNDPAAAEEASKSLKMLQESRQSSWESRSFGRSSPTTVE